MWRFLVGLGLLLALAGLVVVALGVAIFVSSFGNALIATGAICFVGGGTLAAVGLVLRELSDISARLDAVLVSAASAPAYGAQTHYYDAAPEETYEPEEEEAEPAPLPAPVAPPAPEPVAAPPAARTFSPPPFLRPAFDRNPAPPPAPAAAPVLPEFDFDEPEDEPAPVAPPARPAPQPSAPAPSAPPTLPEPSSRLPEALQRGRVLGRLTENAPFPPRARPEPTPAPEPETDGPTERLPERSMFGTRTFTPPGRRPDLPAAPPPAAPPPAAPASPAPYAPPSFTPPTFTPPAPLAAPPAPAPAPAAEEPSVLKSGVVGGMAYTLYTDGSIQAELPDGVLRFSSLQELRDHVARSAQKPG